MDKSKDPINDFINSLPDSSFPTPKQEPDTNLPNYADIPNTHDEDELYIQDLIIKSGIPFDKDSYDYFLEIYKEYLLKITVEVPKHFWQYLTIFLWDIFVQSKQKMTAMKLAMLWGLTLGRLLDWDNGEE